MKIMIAGSTNWIDQNIVAGALMRLVIENGPDTPIELMHMGTDGAVAMAVDAWSLQGREHRLVTADPGLGRRGPTVTLALLAEAADAAIVFMRNGDSYAKRAAWYANRAEIPVKLYSVDDMRDAVADRVI